MTADAGRQPQRFPFAFQPGCEGLLALGGIRPATCAVVVDAAHLHVHFGRWLVVTPLHNVADARVMHGYRWYRVLGPRASLADRGASFGTTTAGGTCISFHAPVPILFGRRWPHPALTVTVADPERLAEVLRAHHE